MVDTRELKLSDDLDFTDAELFDISDIEIDFQRTKGCCKVYMILSSQTPINLLRFYLAVKGYVEKMEAEIGIITNEEDLKEQ